MKLFAVAAVAAVAALSVAMSGCASIIDGSKQTVAISTPPATGSSCELSSSQGSWTVASPGTVTVARSRHDIQVHCNKEGYQEASATIPSNFNPWTLGNVILGGLIGIGVDAATGAINEYPDTFEVPMTASVAAAPAEAAPPAASNPASDQTGKPAS